MSTQSKGKCNFCEKEYTKTSMQKHISACKERKHRHDIIENDKKSGYFGLSITGKYNKDYWLLIEVKEEATLKDIDKFLRDIWLECCDHLSSFKIDGTLYDSNPAPSMGWGQPVKSMNCKLKSITEKGMRFDYEYDFGSTTALTISVFDYRIGSPKKEKLTILSRNNPIEYICDECGEKIATSICPVCIYQDKSLFCDDCQENHDCGEEMLLKICNSPRFGVCGYDGSTKYPD
jgi:hypothetical protein